LDQLKIIFVSVFIIVLQYIRVIIRNNVGNDEQKIARINFFGSAAYSWKIDSIYPEKWGNSNNRKPGTASMRTEY
jgi:hypothetical protein